MDILKTIVYSGPNRWSASPAIETHVKSLQTAAGGLLELEFNAWTASLIPHFEVGLVSDADLESEIGILALLSWYLHEKSGVPTKPHFAIPLSQNDNVFALALEFEEESLARECVATAVRIIEDLKSGKPIDLAKEQRRLVDLADDVRLGPSSRAILTAAMRRGIPFQRLNCGSLVQLGEGIYQRRIWTAETDATSAIAESIARDKQLTRGLLASVGVPVASGRAVHSREDAWEAAQEVGMPVVVKPRDANHARGVSLDLRDRDAICDAYDWACKDGETNDVLVEQYAQGDHHRLLVVGNKLVAAAKGQREFVVGDGKQTITELVDELNRDPRRGENYTDPLGVLKLDDAAVIELRKQDLTLQSVPELGRQVLIRHVGDLVEDCTESVHPSTAEAAVLSARVVGLDIAGLDIVVSDISKPIYDQRGCIIEVNAGPSLAHHVAPVYGKAQPVGEAIVNLLFSDGAKSRVPVIVVVCRNSATSLVQKIEASLQANGWKVGVADSTSIRADGQLVSHDKVSFQTTQSLFIHPFVDCMIVECTMESIVAFGLHSPRADFVVLANDIWIQSESEHAESLVEQSIQSALHATTEAGKWIIEGNLKSKQLLFKTLRNSGKELGIDEEKWRTEVLLDQTAISERIHELLEEGESRLPQISLAK